ncbi:thioesterase domain-containing protein [Phytohabitans houttuyneae]|uniref:thioesterase II family protein n=1 Tax=Phytohabitans houttuyneae TaxID=1076126 RepID=UPI0031E71EA6
MSGWFIRALPGGDDPLLFGLPYTGMGASSYHDWPAQVGGFHLVPLQPPGREGRFREGVHQSHAAFAEDLVAAIGPYTDRRYAITAHCGAVPYALETVWRVHSLGLAPPVRLLASSWGAPQRGLYGRLNHIDLSTLDGIAEVKAMGARLGRPVPDDLADLLADVLEEELRIQRGYHYRAEKPLPCPVTVVGWSEDDVVPDREVHQGWEEVAKVRHETLDGRHRDYLSCPPALREVLLRDLEA